MSEFSKRTCVRLKSILKHVCNHIIFNINARFISQNNEIIFFAFLLLILTFLNSAGNTEAGPINVSQPFTTDDNAIIGEQEQFGESSYPDEQESGILDDGSATGETDTKVTPTVTPTAPNPCVERYEYRIIYNFFFRIPICKQSCLPVLKIVNFGNGRTLGIVYDCIKPTK